MSEDAKRHDCLDTDQRITPMKAQAEVGLGAFAEDACATLDPKYLHFGDLSGPVRIIYQIMLADGTTLQFPLKGSEPVEESIARVEGLFEELWAVPGVRELFDRHGVVVGKEGKTQDV